VAAVAAACQLDPGGGVAAQTDGQLRVDRGGSGAAARAHGLASPAAPLQPSNRPPPAPTAPAPRPQEMCPDCDMNTVPASGPAPVLARFEDFKAATPDWEVGRRAAASRACCAARLPRQRPCHHAAARPQHGPVAWLASSHAQLQGARLPPAPAPPASAARA
jgi:hypothetical protein